MNTRLSGAALLCGLVVLYTIACAQASNIKCGKTALCGEHSTCCGLKEGGHGCCQFPNATCCDDFCCPQDKPFCGDKRTCLTHPHNKTTDSSEYKNNNINTNSNQDSNAPSEVPRLFTSILKQEPNSNVHASSVPCQDGSVCPDGNTCCHTNSGWGCCPLTHAVCCTDGEHCCPQRMQCGFSGCYTLDATDFF